MLGADDIHALDNVLGDVFDEPVNQQRLADYLKDPTNQMMVAIDGGVVVARVAAVIHRHPDKVTELYIDEVGVAEPWRHKGLATEMLKRMFAHGQSLGWEEVWVGAEPDNAPARKLYESFGREPAEAFVMDLDKL